MERRRSTLSPMTPQKEHHPLSPSSLAAAIIGSTVAGVLVWQITQPSPTPSQEPPEPPRPTAPAGPTTVEPSPPEADPPRGPRPFTPEASPPPPPPETEPRHPERIFEVQPSSPFYHRSTETSFSVEFFSPTPTFRFAKLTISPPDQESSTETITGTGDDAKLVSRGTHYRATVIGFDFANQSLTLDLLPLQ